MKNLGLVVVAVTVFFSCSGGLVYAQDVAPTPTIKVPFSDELMKSNPFGGLDESVQKLDQVNQEGNYRQGLELSIMLTVRYWPERLPLLQRCARSLAGLGKWKDCLSAYDMVASLVSDPSVKGVTETYYQDAVVNRALLCSTYWESLSASALKDVDCVRQDAPQILQFPDEEFTLACFCKGWRHPEAALALASIADATKGLQSDEAVLKSLEKLILAEKPSQRTLLKSNQTASYAFLALEEWSNRFAKNSADIQAVKDSLERFRAQGPDSQMRFLANVLLGNAYSSGGEVEKAAGFYEAALKYDLPRDSQFFAPYYLKADAAKK